MVDGFAFFFFCGSEGSKEREDRWEVAYHSRGEEGVCVVLYHITSEFFSWIYIELNWHHNLLRFFYSQKGARMALILPD